MQPNVEQIRAILEAIGPMGELLEKTHEVLLAHHSDFGEEDCPVCEAHREEMQEIVNRMLDARSRVIEHWADD